MRTNLGHVETKDMSTSNHIRDALNQLQDRIDAAATRGGREAAAVNLVAVTKKHPATLVDAAWEAGVRHVGENYVQEMLQKLEEVEKASELQWHFIGHLQRNKVKQIVGRTALIHAVDSLPLAQEVEKRAGAMANEGRLPGGTQPILLAVNTGGEAQKSGVAPQEAGDVLAQISTMKYVECRGLMTMPPFASAPEDNRRYFEALAELRARLSNAQLPLPELSMGTTGDFEVAVEVGATIIRVGSALFGSRPSA